jgi:hypothetical protein
MRRANPPRLDEGFDCHEAVMRFQLFHETNLFGYFCKRGGSRYSNVSAWVVGTSQDKPRHDGEK